jgi:hypothetical protein
MKCDHIKRLITLTSDNIKRLYNIYLDFHLNFVISDSSFESFGNGSTAASPFIRRPNVGRVVSLKICDERKTKNKTVCSTDLGERFTDLGAKGVLQCVSTIWAKGVLQCVSPL